MGEGQERAAARVGHPGFLSELAARAGRGGEVLLDRSRDARSQLAASRPPRRSSVLLLVAGTDLEDSQLVLEERGHCLRSQPGQFALPGGGADPGDRDEVHTALREAQEETGLDPREVTVLGAFAAIPMPWRSQHVTPVLAWTPTRPPLRAQDPVEVERVVWARLTGEGSLTDPARRYRGLLDDRPVGPVFDLPDDAFVWGFTAMIIEQMLAGLGLDPVPWDAPVRQIPPERRRN
ncbi:NUDIX hydrolase [Brachybacterium epidermidis]|uniref:NUDIX hydrolase n=1 Tax=Brachybacterium epidermidis TaxID=2781983 RepID=UPI00398E818D